MVSDYFDYTTDSLSNLVPDLELDTLGNTDWFIDNHDTPLWQEVRYFLEPSEVQKVIFSGLNSSACQGTVGSHEGQGVDDTIRRSKISWLSPTPFNQWLYKKLVSEIKCINDESWQYNILSIKNLQFTEYSAQYKGNYHKHTDVWTGENTPTIDRKISFSIQLSDPDDYDGGELILDSMVNEQIMSKECGTLIVFPSNTPHQVTPVTRGTRYSLVGWVTGERFK